MSLFDKNIIEKELGYLPNPRENMKFQIQKIATHLNESLKKPTYMGTTFRVENVKFVLGELLEALFYCNDKRAEELGFLGGYGLIKNFDIYTHNDNDGYIHGDTNTYIIVKYTFHDRVAPEVVIVSVD